MEDPTTTIRRVALATCAEVPDLDDEGRLLLGALAGRDVDAVPAVWDDADVDWASYDLVVVRSTWDYAERLPEFLGWIDRVGAATRLLNPPGLMAWSTDKRYLADLASAGVPTVPSTFLVPGDGDDHPWLGEPHVVKPSVGAGSRGALRLGADEADRSRAHVRTLQAEGRTALVQPYVASVDTHGESALVHLDGVLSHALRKGALLTAGAGLVEGLFAQEEMSPREATGAEREVAAAALAAMPVPPGDEAPLYARVDLLLGDDGPLVLELELVEPSLFLEHVVGTAERFAGAIRARLG